MKYMDFENKPFVHDTINLDEIRKLLALDDADAARLELPEHSEPDDEAEFAEPVEEDSLPDITEEESIDPVMEDLEEESESSLQEDAEIEETEEAVSEASMAEEEAPSEETASAQETPAVSEEAYTEEEEQQEKKKPSLAYELFVMLHDVIYLLAAVTLVFVFLVRLVGVSGDSMLPTLHSKDYLLLESNFLYRGDDMQYGDIVVLNVPYYKDKGEGPIVKRIVATEGDTVDIDFATGAVYVNGVMLQETYIKEPTYYNWDGEYAMEYPAVVPENCIFVLGDNRNNSMDSRYAPIGMIDERCVLGKVLLIVLPGQTVDERGNVIDPREWGRIGLVS